jgi:hypothetical protein
LYLIACAAFLSQSGARHHLQAIKRTKLLALARIADRTLLNSQAPSNSTQLQHCRYRNVRSGRVIDATSHPVQQSKY